MDILEILSNDERVIVLSSKMDRSIYTWNHFDTLQCWRPSVRGEGYNFSFDPDNWEEVAVLIQSGYGPKTFEEAKKVALAWHTNSL